MNNSEPGSNLSESSVKYCMQMNAWYRTDEVLDLSISDEVSIGE